MRRILILKLLYLPLFIGLFLTMNCTGFGEDQTAKEILKEHIEWLASDEREGRLAGTLDEAESANYIADTFFAYGLGPAGDERTFLQHFVLSGPMADMMESENVISRNVIGEVTGTRYPDRTLIIGAHYDGQGLGGPVSMDHDSAPVIHPSADDNASGTAGLLYLANYYSQNPAEHSITFIAFSGEELGLLGSRHFVETLETPRDSIIAMINLDMIGRLSEGNLTLFGTGTSNIWEDIMEKVPTDTLIVNTVPSGAGSSDHASFYNAGIPALHYFSGTHEDYHRASDTPELINYEGMEWILNHLIGVVYELGLIEISDIEFFESSSQHTGVMSGEHVTLGVMPDYGFSGDGFRIVNVRAGQPAELAGLISGDIIIQMGEQPIADIYSYMEALTTFKEGDETVIIVNRNGSELELSVRF
ncbi:MAG: M28 family peptidase [Balneolaceae bacterium]